MKLQKQGFTLVELIVVITILAILGTIAFISLQGYSANSRDSVRISDTQNMKTSLELFFLNSGKYPLPDEYGTAQYSSNDLFYQGIFGTNVLQSVSRNMSEVPTDPLTQLEYIYSVSNTKNELEILSLLEGDDYVYNSLAPLSGGIAVIGQTNAAGTDVVARITGNYNGLFVETSSYIIPLPSIINTEVDSSTVIELTQSKIESMVTNLGENIPDYGNIASSTGTLTNLTLAVWTGTLDNYSTNEDKLAVFTAIQTAYTGSILANEGIIADVLSKTTEEEKLAITNTLILNNAVTITASIPVPKTVADCGSIIGEVIYTTSDGTDEGLTCSDDIITCNGISGSGITISACNAGATTVYTNQTFTTSYAPRDASINEWAGGLYQWGNNADNSFSTSLPTTSIITTPVSENSTYSSSGFINSDSSHSYDWINPQQDNLWGNTIATDDAKKGPCISGYHVPSQLEWVNLVNLKWDNDLNPNQGSLMITDLKMPLAGYRRRVVADLNAQNSAGYYWSTSPSNTYGYYMYLNLTNVNPGASYIRASASSIRCFKN